MNSVSDFCTIQLNKGLVAIVDKDDYEYLSRFKWYASPGRYCWYAVTHITRPDSRRRVELRMHREVFVRRGICIDGIHIDHADGDGLNNRFFNLRKASYAQNNINQKTRKDNSSGFKGVHYHVPDYGKPRWRARLSVSNKRIHLGLFETPEEAAIAYNEAAIKHFGEFAFLNTIPVLNHENIAH